MKFTCWIVTVLTLHWSEGCAVYSPLARLLVDSQTWIIGEPTFHPWDNRLCYSGIALGKPCEAEIIKRVKMIIGLLWEDTITGHSLCCVQPHCKPLILLKEVVFHQPTCGNNSFLKSHSSSSQTHYIFLRLHNKKGWSAGEISANYFCLPGMAPRPDEKKTPLWKVMHVGGYPAGGTVDTAVDECIMNA